MTSLWGGTSQRFIFQTLQRNETSELFLEVQNPVLAKIKTKYGI